MLDTDARWYLFAHEAEHFANEIVRGPEAGLCQKQIFVPDEREIDNDRGVRDNNHTPRMRSMAARSQ